MAVLLGVLVVGYFVLAGLDYGVAMVARERSDYDRIAVFFLANEVWLVGAAGFLIGAYPVSEGELFGAHGVPVGVALLGVVTVTAAYGMRLFTRGRVLDAVAKIGGIVATAGWGAALAGMAFGSTARHDPAPLGSALLDPAAASGNLTPSVMGAAVAVVLFAVHGWAFLNRRWAALGATSAAIVAAVLLVGWRLQWTPADAATLDVVVPIAWVVVPLLLLIQAITWWMFRDTLRPLPHAASHETPPDRAPRIPA
ncbi:cytochrome d ubiquinol oxidase subunit II [Allorhizocola rhizosphaerae]|uniref:cytochrome d ubiquinol oxidase subunit II n=1 Tax=Allorhizocola rhizosphaerae TaxID=1872709 RepID=UPI000E3C7753|nr:cytochrome d ubiquinol oxidase subunit II [Allorhizocola rhizosphaerae]